MNIPRWDPHAETRYMQSKARWHRLVERFSFFKSPLVWGSILALTLVGIGTYLFFYTPAPVALEDLPIIKGQEAPYRIRPENAGETNIPHQDKLIYNRLQPGGIPETAESLLPEAEKPVTPQDAISEVVEKEVQADLVADVAPTPPPLTPADVLPHLTENTFPAPPQKTPPSSTPRDIVSPVNTTPPSEVAQTPRPELHPDLTTMHKSVTQDNHTASARPALPVRPALPPKKPQTLSPTNASTNRVTASNKVITSPAQSPPVQRGYRVQLGALDSLDLARAHFKALLTQHTLILKRYRPVITPLDLGPRKGIKYLVQVGFTPKLKQAQALCDALKRRNVDCFIVSATQKLK